MLYRTDCSVPGTYICAYQYVPVPVPSITIPICQVFLTYVNSELPRDEVKVLIGDNLRAHMSPEVTSLCEQHNIRYHAAPYVYLIPTGTVYRLKMKNCKNISTEM
jgi:hypothetical protein